MEVIHQYGTWLVLITAVFGFFMAFGIGANDVSNSMGTSVGSGTITAKQAIIIALIFESAGAYLAGGEVTETIKSGVIDPMQFTDTPDILALGMLSALFASGAWLFIATKMGWPVSGSVDWSNIGSIVGSWFITPVIAGLLAYAIFASTQKLIFDTDQPLKNAQKFGPYYMGITVLVLCIVTMTKGLKHVGLNLSDSETLIISLLISVIGMLFCHFYFKSRAFTQAVNKGSFGAVEKIFSILMLLTACAMAFAHGSNDVANAIGPLSAVVSIVNEGGKIISGGALAWWILPLGALGIAVGLITMGQKVMATVGSGITDLTPSRGFAAQFATAMTVVVASGTGLPISTTQTLVGAILGIGFARGIAALNLTVIRNIISSWVVTLPAGAFFATVIFYTLRAVFHQ